MLDGELRIRSNGGGATQPHMVWDDAQNRAVEAVGDPVRPSYAGNKETFALPQEVQDSVMVPVLRERDQTRAEYQSLAELESSGTLLTPEQHEALRRSEQEVIRASGKLGEEGAAAYVRAHYARPGSEPELIYGGPNAASKPGDFDQVWRVQGTGGWARYVVVEAKGGTSPLRTRMVGDRAAMQGTRLYFDRIVEIMGRSGNPSATQTAAKLVSAARHGEVTYLEARVPIKLEGAGRASAPSVQVHEFNITTERP